MYAKIFTSLFDGSMRGKSDLILVFVNILCHSDQDGICDRHWKAISDETGLPVERVMNAIKDLEGPDSQSRTPGNDGARLCRIDEHRDWGWEVVNFKHYREISTQEDRRKYMQRYMLERRKHPVNKSKQSLANTSASAYDSTSESDNTKKPHGEFQLVLLTDEEYAKLVSKNGEQRVKDGIDILDSYMKSNGRKYKDHYAVLKENSWVWTRLDEAKKRSGIDDKRLYDQMRVTP